MAASLKVTPQRLSEMDEAVELAIRKGLSITFNSDAGLSERVSIINV